MLKCPKQCISLLIDKTGFRYPSIDNAECVECKSCQKVCPVNNKQPLNTTEIAYKAMSVSSIINIYKSSSGGTVSGIIECFIKLSGIVYTSAFDEKLNVCVRRIVDLDDIEKIQGSKYVQSYTGSSFTSVKEDLEKGSYVLFIGTPCQIAGLYAFLGHQCTHNLFTIDLLCAGVGSPVVYEKYVECLQEKYVNISNINFRNKKYGYGFYVTSIRFGNNKEKILSGYEAGFSECIGKGYIRKACFDCIYHQHDRIGDISIGDYGNKNLEKAEKKYGANIIFINTKKGAYLAKEAIGYISLQEIALEVISKKRLSTPLNVAKKHSKPKTYDVFFEMVMNKGWPKAYSTFMEENGYRGFIKKHMPKKIYYWVINK